MKKQTVEHKEKLSKTMKNKWQDPEWRKQMIEKQKKAGLR